MKVRDLMQGPVATVKPDDDLALAAQVMAWASIRHLPVIEKGRVIGVLSERDVVHRSSQDLATLRVRDVMTSPAHTLHPDDDIAELAARFAQGRIGCLPVIERGALVGIVTTTDVVAHLAREAFMPRPSAPAEERELLVRDVMSHSPETVALDDHVFDAAARMSQHSIRHLPVIDGDGHVVGMLSDRDLRTVIGDVFSVADERAVRRRVEDARVRDVTSTRAVTVRDSAPLDEAIRLLVDHRIGAVPVVDEEQKLVGIVSYVDVLARSRVGSGSRQAASRTPEPPHVAPS